MNRRVPDTFENFAFLVRSMCRVAMEQITSPSAVPSTPSIPAVVAHVVVSDVPPGFPSARAQTVQVVDTSAGSWNDAPFVSVAFASNTWKLWPGGCGLQEDLVEARDRVEGLTAELRGVLTTHQLHEDPAPIVVVHVRRLVLGHADDVEVVVRSTWRAIAGGQNETCAGDTDECDREKSCEEPVDRTHRVGPSLLLVQAGYRRHRASPREP